MAMAQFVNKPMSSFEYFWQEPAIGATQRCRNDSDLAKAHPKILSQNGVTTITGTCDFPLIVD
jgi:hypothetical protein